MLFKKALSVCVISVIFTCAEARIKLGPDMDLFDPASEAQNWDRVLATADQNYKVTANTLKGARAAISSYQHGQTLSDIELRDLFLANILIARNWMEGRSQGGLVKAPNPDNAYLDIKDLTLVEGVLQEVSVKIIDAIAAFNGLKKNKGQSPKLSAIWTGEGQMVDKALSDLSLDEYRLNQVKEDQKLMQNLLDSLNSESPLKEDSADDAKLKILKQDLKPFVQTEKSKVERKNVLVTLLTGFWTQKNQEIYLSYWLNRSLLFSDWEGSILLDKSIYDIIRTKRFVLLGPDLAPKTEDMNVILTCEAFKEALAIASQKKILAIPSDSIGIMTFNDAIQKDLNLAGVTSSSKISVHGGLIHSPLDLFVHDILHVAVAVNINFWMPVLEPAMNRLKKNKAFSKRDEVAFFVLFHEIPHMLIPNNERERAYELGDYPKASLENAKKRVVEIIGNIKKLKEDAPYFPYNFSVDFDDISESLEAHKELISKADKSSGLAFMVGPIKLLTPKANAANESDVQKLIALVNPSLKGKKLSVKEIGLAMYRLLEEFLNKLLKAK